MNVDEKTFFDYIFDKSETDYVPLCSESILPNLSPIENFFVDFVFWGRNHKKGLQYCIANETFIGASGALRKGKVWLPDGLENCDNNRVGPWEKTEKGKNIFHPFCYREHCNTLAHIAFLVKYRPVYIINKVTRNRNNLKEFYMLFRHYNNNDLPLLFNYKSKNPKITIIQDFASGYFSTALPERKKLELKNDNIDKKKN